MRREINQNSFISSGHQEVISRVTFVPRCNSYNTIRRPYVFTVKLFGDRVTNGSGHNEREKYQINNFLSFSSWNENGHPSNLLGNVQEAIFHQGSSHVSRSGEREIAKTREMTRWPDSVRFGNVVRKQGNPSYSCW